MSEVEGIAAIPTDSPGVSGNSPGIKEALSAARDDVEVAPLRESEINNAVSFLTNPKVVGSGAGAKRAFLKSKGLTDIEIDEAVRRAAMPQPQPAPASVPAPPAPPASSAGAATTLTPPAAAVSKLLPAAAHTATWQQTALTAAVLACASYGIGNLLTPYIKRAWAYMRQGSSYGEEDMQTKLLHLITACNKQQNETAQGVKAVAQTVQELKTANAQQQASEKQALHSDIEGIRTEVASLTKALAETSAITRDITDIKSMLTQQATSGRSSPEVMSRRQPSHASPGFLGYPPSQVASKGSLGAANNDPWQPSSFLHGANGAPKGFHGMATGTAASGQAMAPGTTGHPAINAPPGFARPADGLAIQGGSDQALGGTSVVTRADVVAQPSPASPSEPQKPADYLQILSMLEQGKTPPGIRNDIKDTPPYANMQATPPQVARRPKPWETAATPTGGLQEALQASSAAPSGAPWQQDDAPAMFARGSDAGMPMAELSFHERAPNGTSSVLAQDGTAQVQGSDVFSDASAPNHASPRANHEKRNANQGVPRQDGPNKRPLQLQASPDAATSIASVPVDLSPMDQSLQGSTEVDGV